MSPWQFLGEETIPGVTRTTGSSAKREQSRMFMLNPVYSGPTQDQKLHPLKAEHMPSHSAAELVWVPEGLLRVGP